MSKFFEELNSGLFQDEILGDEFPSEEGSLTGHSLTEARLCTVQAIFQMKLTDRKVSDVMAEFLIHQIRKRKADKKLFRTLMEDVADAERFALYEQLVASNLNEKWTYERLDLTSKSILLSAISELYTNPKAPTKVILNEFINISKGFLNPDEVSFINGALDVISAKIRPNGVIEALDLTKTEEVVTKAEEEVS